MCPMLGTTLSPFLGVTEERNFLPLQPNCTIGNHFALIYIAFDKYPGDKFPIST